jgi:lysophospholipase L1-like esterase
VRRFVLAGTALSGGTLAGLFLAEVTLAVLGYPALLHEQVANPPHHRVQVDNLEYQYLWQTNSQGLRYREIPLRKPRERHRVFVVGDSFTDGEGVETSQRYTNRLEVDFDPGVDFINAGLGGQGVLQYARVFHWVGTKYRPDALLICVNANDLSDVDPGTSPPDIYDIVREPSGRFQSLVYRIWPRIWCRVRRVADRWSPAIPETWEIERFDLEKVEREAYRRGIIPQRIESWKARLPRDWVEAAVEGRVYGYLLTWGLFRPQFHTVALDVAGPRAEDRWRAMASILSEMLREAHSRSIEVAVVFLPHLYLYDPAVYAPGARFPFDYLGGQVRSEWATETTEIQRRLDAWAHEVNVPYLDLTEDYRRAAGRGEQLHFAIDGHWNAAGHRLAAERIARWIREEGVYSFAKGQ